MITTELAHRLGQPPPAVHCLDPGTVNSKLLEKGWGMIGMDLEVRDGCSSWLAGGERHIMAACWSAACVQRMSSMLAQVQTLGEATASIFSPVCVVTVDRALPLS